MRFKRIALWVVVVVVMSMLMPGFAMMQGDDRLPLSEPGPYGVDVLMMSFVDETRDDRIVALPVWYPAHAETYTDPTDDVVELGPAMVFQKSRIKAEPSMMAETLVRLLAGESMEVIAFDDLWAQVEYGDITGWVMLDDLMIAPAAPDLSGAPYPMILIPAWDDRDEKIPIFEHLASHGFIVVIVERHCFSEAECIADTLLDNLFSLDQLAQVNEGLLAGMIDAEHSGVIGIQNDSISPFEIAGARIDPECFSEWVASPEPELTPQQIMFFDTWVERWDEVEAYRAQFGDVEPGELWSSITDDRILAVVSSAPWGLQFFCEDGPAAAMLPTIIFGPTNNQFVSYEHTLVPFYERYGAEDKTLITFIGYDKDIEEWRMGLQYYKHFTTAFFGYHLQGNESYLDYLTDDFVNQFEDLAWGVYSEG